jgi:hypothetical protein
MKMKLEIKNKNKNEFEVLTLASSVLSASSFSPVGLMSKEREKWNPKICV